MITGNARGGPARWRVVAFYAGEDGIPPTRFVREYGELHEAYAKAEVCYADASSVEIERVRRCYCPDDCNCRHPWRTNYCGCQCHGR